MNSTTRKYIEHALSELTLAEFDTFSNTTDREGDELQFVRERLAALLATHTFTVDLEGWRWVFDEYDIDERKYTHVIQLVEYEDAADATTYADELVSKHKRLVEGYLNGNSSWDGMAVVVYEHGSDELKPVEMHVLQPCRKPEYFWGPDAEHPID